MTYKTYNPNTQNQNPPSIPGFGYEKLVVYWLGTTIFDLTVVFTARYITFRSRTKDQMDQAARSGKQCLVEGSIGRSHEGNIKLSDVSHNSYGELLEDYKDYLRQHGLSQWDKNDPRVLEIRQNKDLTYKPQSGLRSSASPAGLKSYTTYMKFTNDPESFSNLMITLCYKQLFLMDRFIKANEERFIREGGFRENLFKKRMAFKKL